MTTKKYLSQVLEIETTIKLLSAEIEHRRAMAQSISAVISDSDRVQSSGSYDKMADKIAIIIDKEEELKNTIIYHDQKRDEIVKELNQLENTTYFNVLFGKYISGLSLYEIGEYMNRKQRQMVNIHGYALLAFEKKFGEKYKNI